MKNTIKNEARTSLMTTLTAVHAASKDAKRKRTEKTEAANDEYRKLDADRKAEKTSKNVAKKTAKKAVKKDTKKAAETAAEKAA